MLPVCGGVKQFGEHQSHSTNEQRSLHNWNFRLFAQRACREQRDGGLPRDGERQAL